MSVCVYSLIVTVLVESSYFLPCVIIVDEVDWIGLLRYVLKIPRAEKMWC